MRKPLVILVTLILFSCAKKDEPVTHGFDMLFNALDKKANSFNIGIRSDLVYTESTEANFEKEYGSEYKDAFLIPIFKRIARTNLKNYSAGEIYNYQRPEIERKILDQTKLAFDSIDIEVTRFFITTIEIPDDLMKRLEQEHLERKGKN
ncbi:hypothetical protein BFP97_06540 [Roseivirga sp. 4D4]|uniref:SPFH domain-containing protein n=1 Tax=Roseivirga sp. 4D4 TaxID=1889784 RepID=UPI000853C658|nr:SPFH domain-containing protein [Roseivirga sp. 4D4]OEK01188.1 hypothetical protein BFP97_06540 [Roseivirga sp. 4D4]